MNVMPKNVKETLTNLVHPFEELAEEMDREGLSFYSSFYSSLSHRAIHTVGGVCLGGGGGPGDTNTIFTKCVQPKPISSSEDFGNLFERNVFFFSVRDDNLGHFSQSPR